MRQYHEIYGFMPSDVINRLSQSDRNKMFLEWLSREPTPTGWFFEKIYEGINSDGTEVTRENLLEGVKELMNAFASDINILYEYVELYQEEYPEKQNLKTETSTVSQPRDPKTGRFMKK